jgi:uncharacterized membrane protein YccC
MPAAFALGGPVLGNPVLATFAALGSFAMLLLVDFGGPLPGRLKAEAALAVAGGILVCLGTLASQRAWLAAVAMAVVGFVVIFAGVVSSVLAGATTALLLAFILPVSLAAPASSVPARLAGWGLASAAALAAVTLLWPAPARDPLRGAASAACRALAARLRSEAAYLVSGGDQQLGADHDRAAEHSDEAVSALDRSFLATPYRPTGLSTSARAIVRLVDEMSWLNTVVTESWQHGRKPAASRAACAVKVAAAEVLDRGADLLDLTGATGDALHAALTGLAEALAALEGSAMADLPVQRIASAAGPTQGPEPDREFITSLDPVFRAQEVGFGVSLIGRNIELTAAAERRSWPARLLGRQPAGLPGTVSAAQRRAASHLEPHSVWLHNSVRGAIGLGLAVLIARLTGVQHSFWVVLGALSVLRSNALSTGQDIVRALAGTVAGFVIAGILLTMIGTNTTLLWCVLPAAVFVAGVAPAAISFAAGQAAFTLTLVILFNIIAPAGWRVGLLRVEDIALGCAVSLVVGAAFWPRGAGSALRRALADAYAGGAAYLGGAVTFGMLHCDGRASAPAPPVQDASRAGAAARRLDDAFRTYLAERGAKPIPLTEVTRLVTGVAVLRLTADAVLDLWQHEDGDPAGDRAAARREILDTSLGVRQWYDELAADLVRRREPREPLGHDKAADARLVQAVRHDLASEDGTATAVAVRMIWTGEHLDGARRLQAAIVAPARATAAGRAASPSR